MLGLALQRITRAGHDEEGGASGEGGMVERRCYRSACDRAVGARRPNIPYEPVDLASTAELRYAAEFRRDGERTLLAKERST